MLKSRCCDLFLRSLHSTLILIVLTCTLHHPRAQAAAPQIVIQSGHRSSIHQVAISPDGKWLATVGGGEVRVWSGNGAILSSAPVGGDARAVAWQPDGKNVVVGVGGTPGYYVAKAGDSAGGSGDR